MNAGEVLRFREKHVDGFQDDDDDDDDDDGLRD